MGKGKGGERRGTSAVWDSRRGNQLAQQSAGKRAWGDRARKQGLPARVTVGREHALKARARCEPATGIAARNELAAAARVAGKTPAYPQGRVGEEPCGHGHDLVVVQMSQG